MKKKTDHEPFKDIENTVFFKGDKEVPGVDGYIGPDRDLEKAAKEYWKEGKHGYGTQDHLGIVERVSNRSFEAGIEWYKRQVNKIEGVDNVRDDKAAVAAYIVSMDKVIEGKLTLTRREDYRWGFYDGTQWQKEQKE